RGAGTAPLCPTSAVVTATGHIMPRSMSFTGDARTGVAATQEELSRRDPKRNAKTPSSASASYSPTHQVS
ncbi:MAG: hypothetical protein ACKO9V_09370, partial [Candidatus Kapaibacterium sp.]